MTKSYHNSMLSSSGAAIKLLISRLKWIVGALVIIGSLAWINRFPDGMVFAGGDVVQYFNQEFVERNFRHIWSNIVGEGDFSPVFLYYPFYKALFWVSGLFGLNPSQQSILYMLFFFGGAYFSCVAGISLATNKKIGAWSPEANLLALVYAVNPYTYHAFYFIWGYSPFLFLYAVIPILVAATLKFFSEPGWHRARLLLAVQFVAHLFATIAYANMAFFVAVNFVLIGLSFLIWIITRQYPANRYLLKVSVFCAVELAAAGWSILPQIPFLLEKNGPAFGAVFDQVAWIAWQRMSFWQVFTINPVSSSYLEHHPIATALTIMLIGMIIWLRIVRSGESLSADKGTVMAVVAMIIIIAFVETKGKGIVPVESAAWVFSNPLLGTFRSYGKVLIFVPFLIVLLLCVGICNWPRRARYRLLGMTFILCIISTYPMFFGRLQTHDSVGLNKEQTCENAEYCYLNRIPQEYLEAAAIIKNDNFGGKILSLPYSVINSPGWSNYPMWKHVGADPTIQLFMLPVVQMNAYHAFGYPYGAEWVESGIKNSEWIFQVSANLGVSYFLLHKDVRNDFVIPAEKLLLKYELNGLLKKIYDSKVVSVYRVADDYRRPIVTVDHSQVQAKDTVPEVVKIDPTKYVVMLKPGETRSNLVLREAFSRQWRVHFLPIDKTQSVAMAAKNLLWWQLFLLPSLPEDTHVRYGGYGNAWNIDIQKICEKSGCSGNETATQAVGLLIECWPQRYVYALLFLTLFIGTIGSVIVLFGWRKEPQDRRGLITGSESGVLGEDGK